MDKEESLDKDNSKVNENIKLEPILDNSDGIFHQAGLTLVQESFEKEKQYFDVNVNGNCIDVQMDDTIAEAAHGQLMSG